MGGVSRYVLQDWFGGTEQEDGIAALQHGRAFVRLRSSVNERKWSGVMCRAFVCLSSSVIVECHM